MEVLELLKFISDQQNQQDQIASQEQVQKLWFALEKSTSSLIKLDIALFLLIGAAILTIWLLQSFLVNRDFDRRIKKIEHSLQLLDSKL